MIKIESTTMQDLERATIKRECSDRYKIYHLLDAGSEIINDDGQGFTDSIKRMEKEREMFIKAIEVLSNKIKEEEDKRRKEEYHLIELKKRKMQVEDEILMRTCKTKYQTTAKKFRDEDLIKYIREGNKIICIIKNNCGKFKGVAKQHPEDKFDYKKGMQLAKARAMKEMYSSIVYDLEHSF